MRRILALLCFLSTVGGLGFSASTGLAESPVDVLRKSNDRLHRFVLDNGMICLVKEDHSAPMVAIQIWVGSGSIHEEEFTGGGLSHFLEHMIFKGTTNRATGDIAKDITDAG
ncbi:MAG: insulinase family protein, partial [Lentisphaerota bacterium]